jgi:fatty-acyl-CoA synthase
MMKARTDRDEGVAMTGLDTPLTPLRFLERASGVHPDRTAIVDGPRRWTYRAMAADVVQLARALQSSGLTAGDRVAYLATNSAELLMAHYAVPVAGQVLVALNIRLSPEEIRVILEHSGARLLVADQALLAPLLAAGIELPGVQELVVLPDQQGDQPPPEQGLTPYPALLARADGQQLPWAVADETTTITLNYTSGTTGEPKGVMYTHRGAYLNALGEVITQGFTLSTSYLWTLPMFHCNGWCTTWAVTAAGGTHVCLRVVRGEDIWRLIRQEGIDHLCGAPTVLAVMASAEQAQVLDRPLTVVTAGAPPSPTIIQRLHEFGATVVHVYGLTETYGPYAVCEAQPGWKSLDPAELAVLMARQGVGMITSDEMRVVQATDDPSVELSDVPSVELSDVPSDGVTLGEIVMRGNTVMKGYFADDEATANAFRGGWFHSGDLGVRHPDGYVQLLDRAKDVVVSGGENISTVEVEQALLSHPAVVDVGVIGVPDDRWGERPKAFVVLAGGGAADGIGQEQLIAHVRERIATYKAPREIEFVSELPMTSSGKLRKQELRDKEWAGHTARIQG